MTDPEYSEEKNEQELNLFAEQPRPEDTSQGSEHADNAPQAPRDAGAPADEPQPAQVRAVSGLDDDSQVVAPPPKKPQPQHHMRPGVVAAPRTASPAAAASAPPDESDVHKPLPQPIQQDQTLGQVLTSIRKARGLSIEEVALATRIRSDYLSELEADKLMDSLPSVYISAYVRKLVEVYDLSARDGEILIEKMRGEMPHVQEEIPDKLLENVNEGGLVNEGEIKRMRNITIVFYVFVGVVVLAVVWLIILAFIRHSPAPNTPDNPGASQTATEPVSQTVTLDESELDALIVPETPSISVLKMSKTPGVRDTP